MTKNIRDLLAAYSQWEVCFDCGVAFLVIANSTMPDDGWVCDKCRED